MKLEIFQASLKTHELRLKGRNLYKVSEQDLYAKLFKKINEGSSKINNGMERWNNSEIMMVHARIH